MNWKIKNLEVEEELESSKPPVPKRLKILAVLSLVIGQPLAITVCPGMLLSFLGVFFEKGSLGLSVCFYVLFSVLTLLFINYLFTNINRIKNKVIDPHAIMMLLGTSLAYVILSMVFSS